MKKYLVLLLPISQLLLVQGQSVKEKAILENSKDYVTQKHCTAYVAPGVSKIFDCYNRFGIDLAGAFNRKGSTQNGFGAKMQYGAALVDARDRSDLHRIVSGDVDVKTEGAISGWNDFETKEKFVNPCGEGFRLPTKQEFEGIIANNRIEAVGTFTMDSKEPEISVLYILNEKGERTLMLQASGMRSSSGEDRGARTGYNLMGAFWSSTASDSKNAYALSIGRSLFNNQPRMEVTPINKRNGLSVRCIQK
ncbi:hypothetical protein HZQ13_04610 [Elizabethkingia anophelis]|jgi:uncharacterized protein (TIGR02145 family)|nr:hypothetical protein [Elizabethkingia anophelis]